MLRTVLRVDSVGTAVSGGVLTAGCGLLAPLTGMPLAFALAFGVFQLGGAAALALIAGYPVLPRALVRAVIGVNLVSCAGCLVLAFSGLLPLTGAGRVLLAVGALFVGVFAELELLGLRRMVGTRRRG
nr:hypothetical protein [Streptomyces sp. HNM0574]